MYPTAEPAAGNVHFEAALERVTDAVVITDAEDNVTYVNAAAEKLTGKSRLHAVGQPLAEALLIVDANNGQAIDAAVALAKGSDDDASSQNNAVLLGGGDGAIIIEYSVSVMRDERGNFRGSVTVFRDVMRRRRAELALQASEETLLANAEALFEEKERAQVTLNSIGDAVISIDFRGRVSFLNVIAEKMSGWTQAEASGRLLDETFFLVDSTTREHVSCPAMRAIIENKTVRIESTCALIQRDGTESAVEVSASPIHDKDMGVIGAVMAAHDVTVASDLSAKLARLALHDNLTGLPNRTLLADRLGQALERAQRNAGVVSLLFLDLDRFKPVNDTLGHAIGDELLQAVAKRVHGCLRSSDTLSRYGGDEFIIVLADIAHADDALPCADKVLAAVNAPFEIGGHRLQIGASIGIASSPHGAIDALALMRNADRAMYHAKAAGRNGYRIYSPDIVPLEGIT
jgi:diguanylate cyclase (GGDEF)-like protein/PAS domain S-box-containing protein